MHPKSSTDPRHQNEAGQMPDYAKIPVDSNIEQNIARIIGDLGKSM
ncbi:hypothetical protein ACFPYJ_12315 [Paenibacillus solisilvae]|uniref:Uncharacterized protein n=1 Tax=Paenibacillus solisilvae TaxID=2486751 RepID=A0ABW0VVH4_9BACL